jgi:hypothetical protein
VLGYVGAVSLAVETYPSELAGSSILVIGDNQGAVSCINNLRSPVAEINQALRELFAISSRLRCNVQAQWVSQEELAAAGALSREADASDWGLDRGLYGRICRKFNTVPSVDLFASDTHHMTDEFFSKSCTPGCTDVDAYRVNWAKLMQGVTVGQDIAARRLTMCRNHGFALQLAYAIAC